MSEEASENLEAEHYTESEEPDQPERVLARRCWDSVFILIVSATFAMLDNNIVTYLTPYIKHDLHLSDIDLGWLLGGSFGLFYTLVGVPLAYFIDRYSRKWI